MFPPKKHTDLSGSQLPRIVACPGSFKLHRKYKSDDESEGSVYASEGTMLHKAVEDYLKDFNGDLSYLLEPKLPVTVADDQGGVHTLTPDHKTAIEDCLNYQANVMKTCWPNVGMEIELETTLDNYDPIFAFAGSGGTCDVALIDNKYQVMHIIDWKFGRGILVNATDNDQLRSYALGVALKYIDDLAIENYTFETHIVQPRIGNYSTESVSYDDLVNWAEHRIIPAIHQAYQDKPVYNPGTEQCRWCAAKYKCEARKAMATQAAQNVFQAHSKIDGDLEDSELSQVLQDAKFYEGYISDLREYAYKKLNKGEGVPGFKLVAGRSIRCWTDLKAAEQWLTENYEGDFQDLYVTKFVTPPQAEKLSKKIKTNDGFQELIEKIPGKPTIAPASDKRPALDMTVGAKFEKALEGGE